MRPVWEVSARPELCGACLQLSVETVDSGAVSALIAGHSCQRAFVAANVKVSGAGEPAAQRFVLYLLIIPCQAIQRGQENE